MPATLAVSCTGLQNVSSQLYTISCAQLKNCHLVLCYVQSDLSFRVLSRQSTDRHVVPHCSHQATTVQDFSSQSPASSHNKNRMTHPLRVAKNCMTHPLPGVQKLVTHPLSALVHPPYTFWPVPQIQAPFAQMVCQQPGTFLIFLLSVVPKAQ